MSYDRANYLLKHYAVHTIAVAPGKWAHLGALLKQLSERGFVLPRGLSFRALRYSADLPESSSGARELVLGVSVVRRTVTDPSRIWEYDGSDMYDEIAQAAKVGGGDGVFSAFCVPCGSYDSGAPRHGWMLNCAAQRFFGQRNMPAKFDGTPLQFDQGTARWRSFRVPHDAATLDGLTSIWLINDQVTAFPAHTRCVAQRGCL